nr:hypothetical protein CFP56_74172 [Quercus suber]
MAAAPAGLSVRQSLGVTLMMPFEVSQKGVVKEPNVFPRSTPPTRKMCELTSWAVLECCRPQWPTLKRIGENRGNIMGEGILEPLLLLLSLFQLRPAEKGVAGGPEA